MGIAFGELRPDKIAPHRSDHNFSMDEGPFVIVKMKEDHEFVAHLNNVFS
jgi:hypothetical protein